MSDLPSPRPPGFATTVTPAPASVSPVDVAKGATAPSGLTAGRPAKKITQSPWEIWEARLTSMTSIGIGVALSLILTIHALFVQLPRVALEQVVAAREEAAGLAQDIVNASEYQNIDLAKLSNQVFRAEEFLIPQRENVVSLVAEIEKVCRQSGWKPEISVRAASEKTSPMGKATILPATLRLRNASAPAGDAKTSAFDRLLAILSQLDHFPHKVEITSLSAVADRDASVSSAVVELQFWTRKANEKPAAK